MINMMVPTTKFDYVPSAVPGFACRQPSPALRAVSRPRLTEKRKNKGFSVSQGRLTPLHFSVSRGRLTPLHKDFTNNIRERGAKPSPSLKKELFPETLNKIQKLTFSGNPK